MGKIREISADDYLTDEAPDNAVATVKESFAKITISQTSGIYTWLFIEVVVALVFLWSGITVAGSYFNPESRIGFQLPLANLFYVWQLGSLMEIIGGIIVYDVIRRIR